MKIKKSKSYKSWQVLSTAFTFGFTVATPIVGGAILGYMIDNKLNTKPKATLSFIFTGVFVSAGFIYQTVTKGGKNE